MHKPTGDWLCGLTPEQNLIGRMLSDPTPATVEAVALAVPVEALQEAAHRAIFNAAVELAREGRWNPADVASRAHLNGYPRDLHGTLTATVTGLVHTPWPTQWRAFAVEVIDLHARRRVAAILTNTGAAMATAPLHELAEVIRSAADVAQSSAEMRGCLTKGEVQ